MKKKPKKTSSKPKLTPVQTKVVEALKKQTGWEEIKLGVKEDYIVAKGKVVYKFTGTHPKLLHLKPQSIYTDQTGKVVDFGSLSKPATLPPLNQAGLIKDVSKPRDPAESACEYISGLVDDYLKDVCERKVNTLSHFDEDDECGCKGKGGGPQMVDLVILIDTSGSMSTVGATISRAAEGALARIKCPTNLRVTWLGIAGIFPGTNFLQTSRDYLLANGTCQSLTTPDPGGFPGNEEREEGARSIADLSNCFDWRKGACRSIFYISDEPIHRGNTDMANDDLYTNQAIAAAIANDVTVFSHYITRAITSPIPPDQQNYINLSQQTGGQEYITTTATELKYKELLEEVVCNACGKCKEVDWSKIEPCISISWGDSDCDCLESNDFETLCITVCNCYTNVTFEDFKIGYLFMVDADGNRVSVLPDGTPSIEVLPFGPICFGDIKPCLDNNPTCVSREVVVRTRGAKDGRYKFVLGGICYKASHSFMTNESFAIDICKD